jgi:hypothetical protein
MPKVYSLTIRNRAAAVFFAVVILGAGAVFLTVGLALLAGLAVAGGVLGAGYALVHKLRGRKHMRLENHANFGDLRHLDPALEVKATEPAVISARKSDFQ